MPSIHAGSGCADASARRASSATARATSLRLKQRSRAIASAISRSLTSSAQPPVSRITRPAKYPSAGSPMASDLAIVLGLRTGRCGSQPFLTGVLMGLQPLARFVAYATAGVPPEVMGIGPVAAIPKALKLSGLKLQDIDLIELNEAFAVQSLAVIQELGLDPSRVNVNGGAIALGHPLGCTGSKLTATLLYEMRRRKARYGMVTMCVGGGMGAAGIFERI